MSTHSLSLFAMTETHICQTHNASFLHCITPVGFKLCHRLRAHNLGGGVGFFVNESSKVNEVQIFDSHNYSSLKNIVFAIGSSASPFTIDCVY